MKVCFHRKNTRQKDGLGWNMQFCQICNPLEMDCHDIDAIEMHVQRLSHFFSVFCCLLKPLNKLSIARQIFNIKIRLILLGSFGIFSKSKRLLDFQAKGIFFLLFLKIFHYWTFFSFSWFFRDFPEISGFLSQIFFRGMENHTKSHLWPILAAEIHLWNLYFGAKSTF